MVKNDESKVVKNQGDIGEIEPNVGSIDDLKKNDFEMDNGKEDEFVKIEVVYSNKINYSMVVNKMNSIKSIELTNLMDEDLSNLTLSISTTPKVTEDIIMQIPNLPKGINIDLGIIESVPLKDFILSLSERSSGTINIQLISGEINIKKSYNIEILALKEWPGAIETPEITAAFSLPLDETVIELSNRAKEVYGSLGGDINDSYENKDKNKIVKMVASVYRALEEKNIKFMIPPQRFYEVGQRIRFPKEIMDSKVATALDITMLFSSILETLGLNPIIILNDKHAFLGVFLEDESFSETVIYDISSITKRSASGLDKILVLDPVTVMLGVTDDFNESIENAKNVLNVDNNFLCAIDIKRARALGILPITKSENKDLGNISQVLNEEDIEKLTPKEIKNIDYDDSSRLKVSRNKLWERKLLDLTFRNNLINFRLTSTTIPIVSHDLDELLLCLEEGNQLNILARPSDWDSLLSDLDKNNGRELTMFKSLAKEEFTNKRLRSLISKEELEKRGTKIKRAAKVSLEENGANTLYIVLGMLKYNIKDKKEVYAPIALAPIEITSRILGSGFTIKLREEEVILNETLFEFLKQEKSIVMDALSDIPLKDDDKVDLRKIFSIFRSSILNEEGWDIREEATIGLFSFTKYLMWNDLKNNFDEFIKNDVVRSLVEGELINNHGFKNEHIKNEYIDNEKENNKELNNKLLEDNADEIEDLEKVRVNGEVSGEYKNSSIIDNSNNKENTNTKEDIIDIYEENEYRFLDDYLKERDIIFPVSSDSSQTKAVILSTQGESFVLHGPPGTGKSQTITNIIANALYKGKRVLFVAQKMAALEVVERRLDAIGIGSFCLELHSNKAKKKNVLTQIENALKVTKIKKTTDYSSKKDDLNKRKDELNDIVRALYEVDESSYSIYDLLVNYSRLKDFNKYVDLNDSFEYKNLKHKEMLLENVINLGAFSGGPYMHPLKGINKSEYFPTMKEEIQNVLSSIDLLALSDFLKAINKDVTKYKTIEDVLKYTEFLTKYKDLLSKEGNIFNLKESHNSYVDLKIVADLIDEYNKLKGELLEEFKAEIIEVDPNTLNKEFEEGEDKFFALKMLTKNPVVKKLNDLSLKRSIKKEDVKDIIKRLSVFKKLRGDALNKINSLNNSVKTLDDKKLDIDTQYLRDLSLELNDFFKEIKEEDFNLYRDNFKVENSDEDLTNKIEAFTNLITNNLENLSKLEDLLRFKVYDKEEKIDIFLTLNNKRDEILSNLDGLKDYIQYINAKNIAEDNNLGAFTKYYDDGLAREDEVLNIFRKSVYRNALIKRLKNEPKLVNLTSKSIEEKVKDLESLVEEYRLIEKGELYNTLSSNIPTLLNDAKGIGQLALLNKAIRSSGKNISLRTLIKDTDDTLRKLMPCMLMSPLSVSQYLEAKSDLFDLVVFDEASQMQTPEAIGAIGRGKQVIIVGDPKQLPPTSFFMSSIKEDDENLDEDLDNVLDDALALNMKESYLLWHYRSRHESLISFSNRSFYDNKLYTYPSYNDLVSKVKYIKNDGVYDRSQTRTNVVEANQIVEEVIRRLKDEKLSKYSMGIVTFSKVQQTLIEDILQKKINEDESLEEKINSLPEELFVKNLENVQGDERDVILFSIGYGVDKDNKISMNFGPINQEGGWRRLNVAVSRSRYEMLVFTNINPDTFNVPLTSSRGVIALKDFIKFAKDGRKKQTIEEVNRDKDNEGLSGKIKERLMEEGYKVETTIGSSKFKIDLGVVNPDNHDEFILGIMCGGPSYSEAQSSYDRDILQKSVLEGLNWNLHYIYPMDYLDNEDKEIKILVDKIEALRRGKENKNNSPMVKDNISKNSTSIKNDLDENTISHASLFMEEDSKLDINNYNLIPYEKNNLDNKEVALDEFLKVSNSSMIHLDLVKIIDVEAPISNILLTKRIKERYNLSRISKKVEKQVEMILNKNKPNSIREDDKIIYLGNIKKDDYKSFRKTLTEDNDRYLIDIATMEIKNAIFHILNKGEITERNLIKEVSIILGYPRLNMENELHLRTIINKSTLEGEIKKKDNGLLYL